MDILLYQRGEMNCQRPEFDSFYIANILTEFEKEMTIIHHHQSITEQENSKLTELQSLLLAKMGQ